MARSRSRTQGVPKARKAFLVQKPSGQLSARVQAVGAAGFGIVGYAFFKLGCEPAPLLLGFILGPMMEENLRRALLLSRGDWTAFLTRPLSAGLLVVAVAMIVVVTLPAIKQKRAETFQDD